MMIKASEDFYYSKLREWNTDDCGSYFEWLDSLSKDEQEILNSISENSQELNLISANIRNRFYQILIVDYKQTLVNSPLGFQHLMTSSNFSALRKIKKLFTLYKDDFNLVYDCYKQFVNNNINDRITEYISLIEHETDEKLKRKLTEVEWYETGSWPHQHAHRVVQQSRQDLRRMFRK